jgi:hypothetical protein
VVRQRKILQEVAVVSELRRLRAGRLRIEVERRCACQNRLAPAEKLLNRVPGRDNNLGAVVERFVAGLTSGQPQQREDGFVSS